MNWFFLGIGSFCLSVSLWGEISLEQDHSIARRVQAHLILKDFKSAREEASYGITQYPTSLCLHENYIKSLARIGDEKAMLAAWKNYLAIFPEKSTHRELIEEMCWGVINKASSSSSLPTRAMGMLAGFFSQDTRGIEIIRIGLYSSNSVIRAAAVELASHLHDHKLIEEIKRLFRSEHVWIVRKCLLKAIGKMKIKELLPDLEYLTASDQSLAEEKALAIQALIALLDDIKREEVIRLAKSNRSGLRLLACQAIAHFRSHRDVDQLIELMQDHHPGVRFAAIQALGLVRPMDEKVPVMINIIKSKQRDCNDKVGIAAAWLLTIYSLQNGQEAFKYYLGHKKAEVRLLAAAALNATGKYGVQLANHYLFVHSDPYVRLNLALGIARQKVALEKASEVIDEVFNKQREKWDRLEEGIFEAIIPRNIQASLDESASTTPEMDNQIIRLEVLNQLAILNPMLAQESIRQFLVERTWGVSGTAAALLLMEGNDAALESVQYLLQDQNSKVRIQAALILSLWSREEKVINLLEESYQGADKELKARILEGIGRVGSMSSVPFLIETLQEPSQHLRIIAATALIQCLNH